MAAKKKQGEVSLVREVPVVLPSVEPASAMASAKHVREALSQGAMAARFKALPKAEFDGRLIDAYSALVDAAEAAGAAYVTATAAEPDAMVPLALVQQGSVLKARMFDTAEHNLDAIDDAHRRLNAIRPGNGHLDLVNDLIGLSSLYTDYRDTLARDGNKYKAADAAEASRIAGQIQLALASVHRVSTRNAGKKWATAFDRLRAAHEEIIVTGRWLDRRRDDAVERWPSLFAALRKTSKPSKPGAPSATQPA